MYVSLVGLLFTLYSLTGYEAGTVTPSNQTNIHDSLLHTAGHMAEETKGASKSAPLGMVYCVIASSVVGFAYIIGLLLATAADVPGYVLNKTEPANVFFTCSGQTGGVSQHILYPHTSYHLLWQYALALLLVINMYFAGQGSFTVSPLGFPSQSRDGAFPLSSYIRYVLPSSKAPLGSIIFTCVVDALMISLIVVNTTAFTAVTSLSVIGYQISYAIPIFLRITSSRHSFPRSDFHLGNNSLLVGTIAFTWLFITSCLFLLPTVFPITATNLNYTGVIVAIVAVIGGAYWIFSGKEWKESVVPHFTLFPFHQLDTGSRVRQEMIVLMMLLLPRFK